MPRRHENSPPFRISPSTVARYFFHDCERFLFYSAATPAHRRRLGLPNPAFDRSPLVGGILESGYQWEETVVRDLLKGLVLVAPGKGVLHTRRFSPEQSIRLLREAKPGQYIYQPTLVTPAIFYETYDIDPQLVTLSDNHPDLVMVLPDPGQGQACPEGRLLRVVDVKRGEELRLTHRLQVLLYALELEAILEGEDIPHTRTDLDQGAVWLGLQGEPECFSLSEFRPHLEHFLIHDLPRVLEADARDARWHLYSRCEWCEFFDHCREEMRQSDDVSRLVQLTPFGKRHLHDEAGVRTLTELGQFLKRSDADEVLERCASLAGQRHQLATRVQALQSAAPQLYGAAAPDLPRGENLALFFTLQKEPLSQGVYLAGVLVTCREELRQVLLGDRGTPQPQVWLARTPEELPAVRRQLIQFLDDLFRRVHHYNQEHTAWKNQLSLQAYVHTEQERAVLFATLIEALQDEELREQATTLLCHFQGPELLQANRHPNDEVAYPAVVLQHAIGRLLALPVEVSYTLPEMLEALGSSYQYRRRDYYHFPLGHGLRAEALHAAWYQGKQQNLDEIERQAQLYLFAVSALLRAIRAQASAHLFAWPPRFHLPTGTGLHDPMLSRLAFFARYESLLRCLAIRETRVEARATQVLQGHVLELCARGAYEMEVIGGTPEQVSEIEPGSFPAWLLVRDDEAGRRAQLEYADYWYRNQMYGGPKSPHRAVVKVERVSFDQPRPVLHLGYARAFDGNLPMVGERFLLYQRFTDFTTDKVVKFLEELDTTASAGGTFLSELLQNPRQAAQGGSLPEPLASRAEGFISFLGLTPSQSEAYRGILHQRVTAVWGPPGTGKTHFLASTIIGLALAHAHAGQPFRVLVTAFTHAAIENLLRKLTQRLGELNPEMDLQLGKARHWQGRSAGIDVIPDRSIPGWLEDHPHAVLGATVYACLKQREHLQGFDLVVIDEASQVRVPEAAVAIALVAETGRLVLAGDHFQLPPIVAGVYPDPPEGEPVLHRSIFEAVCPEMGSGLTRRPVVRDQGILRPLLENFRMNDVLTGFAAHLLYGPGYRCNDKTIANRRLAFKPGRGVDPLVQACLDPEYPLVVVILDGIRAAQFNPVEADLIAQFVVALREGSHAPNGKRYTDDADFFRQGVFIVSPHRAQIRAIQVELAARRTWKCVPFVDTVDKMQGQEADAVLVSYGVADAEFALREAEFIYGLNRLNVALTRARVKSVVCLPRPLLEATPSVLEVERAIAGVAFMRRLVDELERTGEELLFEGEEVEAQVLRARVPPCMVHER